MTASDLDRYYTPRTVANSLLEQCTFSSTPKVCADSACGSGSLLEAASSIYGTSTSLGFDCDRAAIAELRKRRPNWILSVGDLMNPKSYSASYVARCVDSTDLLILNPPFSQAKEKSVALTFGDTSLRCSVAMAYILRSLELFRPRQGAVAIVPESLLYADVDANARSLLCDTHSITILTELSTTTFRGTRVHAAAVQILTSRPPSVTSSRYTVGQSTDVTLVRGALPVHNMKESLTGVPFVHSTDLRAIGHCGHARDCVRTTSLAKGRVSGWAVLLPRVGVPSMAQVNAVRFPRAVQLSDCVVAISCKTRGDALMVALRIRRRFQSFTGLYRGTGARYVTLRRLTEWLCEHGLAC